MQLKNHSNGVYVGKINHESLDIIGLNERTPSLGLEFSGFLTAFSVVGKRLSSQNDVLSFQTDRWVAIIPCCWFARESGFGPYMFETSPDSISMHFPKQFSGSNGSPNAASFPWTFHAWKADVSGA